MLTFAAPFGASLQLLFLGVYALKLPELLLHFAHVHLQEFGEVFEASRGRVLDLLPLERLDVVVLIFALDVAPVVGGGVEPLEVYVLA